MSKRPLSRTRRGCDAAALPVGFPPDPDKRGRAIDQGRTEDPAVAQRGQRPQPIRYQSSISVIIMVEPYAASGCETIPSCLHCKRGLCALGKQL